MGRFDDAKSRAKLTDSGVIDARSLKNSHKRLAEIIKPGMNILDVGCGTGAITSGIAKVVGRYGKVVGVDNNWDLIEKACGKYKGIPGLSFEVSDIYNLPYIDEFDVVTSARVLQWLASPQDALNNMIKATKKGGKVIVLDYNHEKIKWEREVPESMKFFYDAFLEWRSDSGMDNTIADNLAEMFRFSGLENVNVTNQHERTTREDDDFQTHITIWSSVATSKGKQMVKDGFIEERMRKAAVKDFNEWIEKDALSQEMYLLAIEGIKP